MKNGSNINIETRAKMSAAKMGHLVSAETKTKITAIQPGDKNPNWKGGRIITKQGYVRIYIGRGSYREEQRLIMEQMLGRPLLKSELVHHADFDRKNNSRENLIIMRHEDHTRYHQNMKKLFEHWLGG